MVPGVCRCTNRVGAKVNRRMGEVVSTFINVELKGASYIIFVLGEFRYGGAIQRALKKALPEFAEEMAVAGRLVQPYSRRSAAVAEEMHGKHWPEPIRQRIQNQEHPFVVMTKEGFESFDPRWHDWRIIWFASARGPTNSIPSLFQLLGRLIVQGGDVFGHLTTIGGATGESPYGHIMWPGGAFAPPVTRRPGAPGVLDAEWGVLERIGRFIEGQDWSDQEELKKNQLAHRARQEILEEHPDFPFSARGIVNAITRKKKWLQFEEQVSKLKRR